MDEVEKDGVIALPGKGGHSRLLPLNTVCANLGGLREKLPRRRVGSADQDEGVCRACTPFMVFSGMKNASTFHLLGVLVLQDISFRTPRYFCVFLEAEPGQYLQAAALLPGCSSLVSASPPFPD